MKVGFWNVAGLGNKDEEFWKRLKEWDVIFLCETWIQSRDWSKLKMRVPKGYEWEVKGAEKINKKGRAIGGIVIKWRKELEGKIILGKDKKEGVLRLKIRSGKRWWKIAGVYVNGDLDKILEEIVMRMEEKEEGVGCLIGGDFNVRTGEEGGLWEEEAEKDEEEKKRRSKDIKITNEGRKFCKFLEKRGWGILNGYIKGDEEGEWTYTGGRVNLGKSVRRKKGEEKGKERKRIRLNWDEEERKFFKEKYGEVKEEKDKNEESWERLGKKIKGVKKVVKKVMEKRKKERKEQAKEVWWDKECREGKKKVKEELEKWRRKESNGEEYRKARSIYKKLCKEKKGIEKNRWEKKIEAVKTEEDV
ncbi:uncharacterized protein [Cardiocondyla obscurior]|uniref:uncharacterized protein n=1 Tax=Cardiocondyla obscurior TaxID=286306 RepID=UPI0039655BF5